MSLLMSSFLCTVWNVIRGKSMDKERLCPIKTFWFTIGVLCMFAWPLSKQSYQRCCSNDTDQMHYLSACAKCTVYYQCGNVHTWTLHVGTVRSLDLFLNFWPHCEPFSIHSVNTAVQSWLITNGMSFCALAWAYTRGVTRRQSRVDISLLFLSSLSLEEQ